MILWNGSSAGYQLPERSETVCGHFHSNGTGIRGTDPLGGTVTDTDDCRIDVAIALGTTTLAPAESTSETVSRHSSK